MKDWKALKKVCTLCSLSKGNAFNKKNCRFPREKDFVTSVPGNGAKKMLFQSLYLRLRSTVSRHPKVGKGWRREKCQPSPKETREYFYVGVV